MRLFVQRWLPALLWAVVIYYFSSIPNLRTEFGGSWDLVLRKCAHATEYAILAWLISRAFTTAPSNYRLRYFAVFLFAAAYAVTDEWHQSFVVGRTATIYDVMIDTVGVLAGILLHGWLILRTKHHT